MGHLYPYKYPLKIQTVALSSVCCIDVLSANVFKWHLKVSNIQCRFRKCSLWQLIEIDSKIEHVVYEVMRKWQSLVDISWNLYKDISYVCHLLCFQEFNKWSWILIGLTHSLPGVCWSALKVRQLEIRF